jgi:1,4-dihydroxy-6-naphthoate synthase
MTHLRLGFSPDSDDLFMFWPLLSGKVPCASHTFEHVRADTQSLNDRARLADLDVVAISIANYPNVADNYLLMPHGGSVGRGYGPVVVTKQPQSLESLRNKKIGVPGLNTTAYLVLRWLLPEFEPVLLPITPFTRSFEAVHNGEVDAVLLIHEGRLCFQEQGLSQVVDIGQAWAERTGGLPLPLGGNAIRKGLGEEVIREVSLAIKQSIDWALQHRDLLIQELLAAETRKDVPLTRTMLDRYLDMYANQDTSWYPDDARQACERLVNEGISLGLFPESSTVSWSS